MQGLVIKNPKELETLNNHGVLYILRHQRKIEGIQPLKDYETRSKLFMVKITLIDLISEKKFLSVGEKYLDRSGHETLREWLESHHYGNNFHSRMWLYRIEKVN